VRFMITLGNTRQDEPPAYDKNFGKAMHPQRIILVDIHAKLRQNTHEKRRLFYDTQTKGELAAFYLLRR